MTKKPGDQRPDKIITADAIYIETSCPCAVFSYDTGNSFQGTGTEISNSKGDPSSVWIAPIEQNIDQITFGICYTDKTKDHFLNVVAETDMCDQTKLEAITATGNEDKSSLLTWNTVPGNPEYSYARAQIGTASTSAKNVFSLSNPRGVLAIVYGNGDDESYAYSAGSAAVDVAVKVNNVSFGDKYVYEDKFCLEEGKLFKFDFTNTLPTRSFEQVYLTFGDGTDTTFYARDSIFHEYKTPGWYDIHVDLIYYEKSCSFIPEAQKEHIDFSFQIAEKEYTFAGEEKECKEADYTGPLSTIFDTVRTDECWRNNIIIKHVGKKSVSKDSKIGLDSYYEPLNGITYPVDPNDPNAYHVDIELVVGENQYGCDSILQRHIDIRTCLHLEVPNDSGLHHACYGKELVVPYKYIKGDIGDAFVLINNKKVPVTPEEGKIVIPTKEIKPGTYSTTISVADTVCDTTFVYPIDFTVYYPDSIFKYKFNNVLAVYNPGYGGNKDLKVTFTAFQWYKDGEPIEGATSSIYTTEEQMPTGEYYVVLTDKNGVTLPSCSQVVRVVDVSPKNSAPAKKVLMNNRIYIEIGDELYDIYGQKVK